MSLTTLRQMPNTAPGVEVSPQGPLNQQQTKEAPSDNQAELLGPSEDDAELAAALASWGDGPETFEQQEEQDGAEGGNEEQDVPEHTAARSQRHCIDLLATLPRELLMRVISFVSAADLCALQCANRAFRELAGEDVLWRRLYCFRYGKPKQQASMARWKDMYRLKDAEEWRATGAGGEAMQGMFEEMQRAKRHQALGHRHIDDVMDVPKNQMQEQLAAWCAVYAHPGRTGHEGATSSGPAVAPQGSPPAPTSPVSPPSPASNSSSQHQPGGGGPGGSSSAASRARQQPRRSGASTSGVGQQQHSPGPGYATSRGQDGLVYDVIGDYYCCRQTGHVHLCDHTCKEMVIHPDTDMLVCPISARTVDRLVTAAELASLQRARSGPVGHDEREFAGFGARAFVDGYYAKGLKQLRRLYG